MRTRPERSLVGRRPVFPCVDHGATHAPPVLSTKHPSLAAYSTPKLARDTPATRYTHQAPPRSHSMATAAATAALPNGEKHEPKQHQPVQLSFPLPRAPNARVNLHLTVYPAALMLFVTTTSPEHDAGSTAPAGSFVYAMPNVSPPASNNRLFGRIW